MDIQLLINLVKKLIACQGVHTLDDVLLSRNEHKTDAAFLDKLIGELNTEWRHFYFVANELTRLGDIACELRGKIAEGAGDD